jgi:hypothetical protein
MKACGSLEVQLHAWTNLGDLTSISFNGSNTQMKEAESASETVCFNRNEKLTVSAVCSFIPSFCSLSYDRSLASSKASSPQSAI